MIAATATLIGTTRGQKPSATRGRFPTATCPRFQTTWGHQGHRRELRPHFGATPKCRADAETPIRGNRCCSDRSGKQSVHCGARGGTAGPRIPRCTAAGTPYCRAKTPISDVRPLFLQDLAQTRQIPRWRSLTSSPTTAPTSDV